MSKKLDNSKPEGRLRLKTSTRSEATSSKPSDPRGEFSEFSNTSTDDSLADFKSPKQTPKILPKVSVQTIRPKKTSSTRKDRPRPKPTDSRRNQQLIPTLFAKTEAESSTFVCPLCLKPFSTSDIQLIHTKNCALKNNVSTERLLAAVELQERQSKERKAIGLPSKPLPNAKRRPSTSRRATPGDDPDIQLALALSMSLNEVEQQEEMDEAIALAAGEDEKVLEMSSSQRRSTLVSFGFSTNKPVNQVIERPRRNRKLLGPTVLQNRTQEIREQILTEKIAEVLVGSESITQQQQQQQQQQQLEMGRIVSVESMGVKRHGELRKWWNESASLWSRSVGLGDEGYYVEELRDLMGISRRGIEGKCFYEIHRTGEDRGVSEDLERQKINDIENCDITGEENLVGTKKREDHDLIEDICSEDLGGRRTGEDREMIRDGENESLEEVKTVEDRRIEKNKRTISNLQKNMKDCKMSKRSENDQLDQKANEILWADDLDDDKFGADGKIIPKIIDDHEMNEDFWGEDSNAKTSEDHRTIEYCKSKNLDVLMITEDGEENNSVAQRTTKDHRVIKKSERKNSDREATVRCKNPNSDFPNSSEDHKMITNIDNEALTSNCQKSADDLDINPRTHNSSREDMSVVDNPERNIKKCFDTGNGDNNFITSLANDWSKMVASSYLSDIVIFVKDTSFIHAHSLVFWTRCHPLTRDYETCNFEDRNDRKCYPIKNKIHWSDIDHDAALIFLKYIYSGQICLQDLRRKDIFQQIIFLGSKYGITELLKFLESLREEVNGAFGIGTITSDVVENSGGSSSGKFFEQKPSVDGIGDGSDSLGEEKNQKNLSGRTLNALENSPNSSSAGVLQQKSAFQGFNDTNENLNRSQKNGGVADVFDNCQQLSNKFLRKKSSIDDSSDDNDFNTKQISRTLRKSQTTEASPNVSKNTDKFSRSFTQQKSSSNGSDLDDNIPETLNRTSEHSSTTPVIEIDSSLDGLIDEGSPNVKKIIEKTRESVEKSFNRRLNTTSPDLFDDSEMLDDFPENSPKLASPNISKVSIPPSPSNKNLETKQKSDLSVFIDKIQRQQARGVLDSDTDGETPVKIMENCKKNPFRVRCPQLDESDPWGKRKSREIDGSSRDRMGPLSILENDIRARPREDLVRIHDEVFEEERKGDGPGDDSHDDFMETTEIPDHGELEESRYSRYKKLERENSIENYRKALIGVRSPFDDSRRNVGDSPGRESRGAESDTEDEEITRDECSQMRRRNHGDPSKNKSERLSISEDLAFDTWEEHSTSSDCILTEGINPVDASKSMGSDANCLEGFSDGREKVSFASSHNLSDDNDEDLLGEKNSREADGEGEGRPLPSPIVLSSDDEVAKVMERSSQENVSQLSDPRCTSQRSSPDRRSGPPPDENLNYFQDRKLSTPSPRQSAQKIPLRDNSESLNRLPSPSGNPLKRTRTPSSLQISHTVTPPLDYLRMASPDLREELNKYGLKPQKRSRAIQLLEHIYDELHPLVPLESLPQETPLTDSENEEPVVKKRHLNARKSPKGKIIPEEMEFQEVEGPDQSGSALRVKAAFQQLLRNDRELYGKILAYEPLPLESLREKLKAEGFGGKINDVMDFLDDECITFQVQTQKKNRRIRNAKNMKIGGK